MEWNILPCVRYCIKSDLHLFTEVDALYTKFFNKIKIVFYKSIYHEIISHYHCENAIKSNNYIEIQSWTNLQESTLDILFVTRSNKVIIIHKQRFPLPSKSFGSTRMQNINSIVDKILKGCERSVAFFIVVLISDHLKKIRYTKCV